MKREVLLVLTVVIVAILAALALIPGTTSQGLPLACFMHGGSTTGICKS